MRRWVKWAGIVFLAAVVSFLFYALVRHHAPVLFHLSGSCACTDYSEEVEGFSVFNPFRDRSPEQASNTFLADISNGRCPTAAVDKLVKGVCSMKTEQGGFPLFQWRLKHREDGPNRVTLYYSFRRKRDEARFSGEGFVELVDGGGGWKAYNYDVMW